MTMIDYINSIEYPVIWYTAVGSPMGQYEFFDPEISISDDSWLDLDGEVTEDNDWEWDGEDHPTDCRRNTITRMIVYSSKKKWEELYEEYNSGY